MTSDLIELIPPIEIAQGNMTVLLKIRALETLLCRLMAILVTPSWANHPKTVPFRLHLPRCSCRALKDRHFGRIRTTFSVANV